MMRVMVVMACGVTAVADRMVASVSVLRRACFH
jgi:hypothetical protein